MELMIEEESKTNQTKLQAQEAEYRKQDSREDGNGMNHQKSNEIDEER